MSPPIGPSSPQMRSLPTLWDALAKSLPANTLVRTRSGVMTLGEGQVCATERTLLRRYGKLECWLFIHFDLRTLAKTYTVPSKADPRFKKRILEDESKIDDSFVDGSF